MPIPLPVPGTGAILRFSKKLKLDVPSCAQCEPAIRWRSSDWLGNAIFMTILEFLLLCFVLSFVAALIRVVGGVEFSSNAQGIGVMVASAILAFWWTWSRVQKKNGARLAGNHVCNECAPVRIATFDADSVAFIFAGESYGRAFAVANGAASEPCDLSGTPIQSP